MVNFLCPWGPLASFFSVKKVWVGWGGVGWGGWVVGVTSGQVLCVLMKSFVFHGFFFNLSTSLILDSKTFLVVWQHGTPVRLRGGRPAYPKRWPGVWTSDDLKFECFCNSRLVSGQRLGTAVIRPGGHDRAVTCHQDLPPSASLPVLAGSKDLAGVLPVPLPPEEPHDAFLLRTGRTKQDSASLVLQPAAAVPPQNLVMLPAALPRQFPTYEEPIQTPRDPSAAPRLHRPLPGRFYVPPLQAWFGHGPDGAQPFWTSTCICIRLILLVQMLELLRMPSSAQWAGRLLLIFSTAADDWFDRSDTIAFPPCAQPDLTSGKDSVIQGTRACQRRSVSRSHFSSSVSAIWLVFTHWVIKMWYTPHKYMIIGSHTHVFM